MWNCLVSVKELKEEVKIKCVNGTDILPSLTELCILLYIKYILKDSKKVYCSKRRDQAAKYSYVNLCYTCNCIIDFTHWIKKLEL